MEWYKYVKDQISGWGLDTLHLFFQGKEKCLGSIMDLGFFFFKHFNYVVFECLARLAIPNKIPKCRLTRFLQSFFGLFT